MTEYPYATNIGSLKDFMEKIRETGVPQKVTYDWMSSVGFKSSNERRIVGVLKAINFIDPNTQVPTSLWSEYRGPNNKKVLAQGIKLGYQELFDTFPKANTADAATLDGFFSTKSSGGKQVIEKIRSTFRTLCDLAEFNGTVDTPTTVQKELVTDGGTSTQIPLTLPSTTVKTLSTSNGVIININIELSIPSTQDPAIYDNFFAAMKKHLLSS